MKHSHQRLGLVLLGAFLLLGAAPPQARKPAPPVVVPRGKLDIRLLVTAEPEKVFRPTKGPDGKMAIAAPATVVPRGKRVAAVVFFKDCKPDTADNCNVDVDLQGVTPSGALFENRKAADLWRNRKAPAPGITQLGSAFMNIQLEAKDPVGTYKVIAVAHDRVGGAEVRAEATFQVQ
jgi:hypothetical protein